MGLVNPWDLQVGEREYKRLVTNCFLQLVVFLNGMTLQELLFLFDHCLKAFVNSSQLTLATNLDSFERSSRSDEA